jgi:hypothetical protein
MEIVVLVRPQQQLNRYGRYTAEILKAEGLNCFSVQPWFPGQMPALSGAAVTVLTRCRLQPEEVGFLRDYVQSGGRLVAFAPPAYLYQAFGARPLNRVAIDGYIKPLLRYRVGRAIGGESIQFHGPAAKVAFPPEFAAKAWLCSPAGELTDHPAVAIGRIGKGAVCLFTYDLPATVVAIRQGDPRLAYEATAGFAADNQCRPNDLFTGHLDASRGHIPQADVHLNLLTEVIEELAPMPLPRLWYYYRPEVKSVLVMTSDDDWSTVEQFEALIGAVEENGGHCLFFMVEGTRIPAAKVREWMSRGHAFSVHTNPRSHEIDPYWHMDESVRRHKRQLEAEYGRPARVYRSHCVYWQGYVESARALAEMGFRMDTSLISLLDHWGLYVNGSGRPMRFADESGEIIDLFEQPVAFYDDASVQKVLTEEPELEVARASFVLQEAAEKYHTPFGFLSHPVSFATYSSRFVRGVLSSARRLGVPILNADEWLEFTLQRDAARLQEICWRGDELSFTLERGIPAPALTVSVPVPQGMRVAGVQIAGQPWAHAVTTVHGETCAMIPLELPAGAALQTPVAVQFAPGAQG